MAILLAKERQIGLCLFRQPDAQMHSSRSGTWALLMGKPFGKELGSIWALGMSPKGRKDQAVPNSRL